jgi:hypothetical protein
MIRNKDLRRSAYTCCLLIIMNMICWTSTPDIRFRRMLGSGRAVSGGKFRPRKRYPKSTIIENRFLCNEVRLALRIDYLNFTHIGNAETIKAIPRFNILISLGEVVPSYSFMHKSMIFIHMFLSTSLHSKLISKPPFWPPQTPRDSLSPALFKDFAKMRLHKTGVRPFCLSFRFTHVFWAAKLLAIFTATRSSS